MRRNTYILLAVVFVTLASTAFAQQPARNVPAAAAPAAAPAPQRPPLFFRETWKDRPKGAPEGDLPMTQEYVSSPNLDLKLYGAGAKAINPSVTPEPEGPLTYVWTGVVEGNWILALRDKNNYVDLTGLAKVRWRTRMRGFHELRLVLKLSDGTMLASDYSEPTSVDWRETEFYLADVVRWRVLDPEQAVESRDSAWRYNIDLSKVDEVGFTDLSRGACHGQGGNSGIDFIEVYGKPVKRSAAGK
jgi:hypothetical protein